MMTGFTRIIIVLGLLRNALGTPSTPPNQVLLGLALFVTFFVMSPVFNRVYEDARLPLSQDKISLEAAVPLAAADARIYAEPHARSRSGALYAHGEAG